MRGLSPSSSNYVAAKARKAEVHAPDFIEGTHMAFRVIRGWALCACL